MLVIGAGNHRADVIQRIDFRRDSQKITFFLKSLEKIAKAVRAHLPTFRVSGIG